MEPFEVGRGMVVLGYLHQWNFFDWSFHDVEMTVDCEYGDLSKHGWIYLLMLSVG
jgi:hypothetical protein